MTQRPTVELERLYQEHSQRVFRAAYRVTGSAADAEDVLQTVFLRLVRREEPDLRNVESYLYRAAVNAAVDLLRSRHENRRVSLEDLEQRLPGPSEGGAEENELRRLLRRALARLSPRAAEMFVLRYFEEYSNQQIAALLKTSQAVVAVTLFRTRRQLQKELEAYKGEAR